MRFVGGYERYEISDTWIPERTIDDRIISDTVGDA